MGPSYNGKNSYTRHCNGNFGPEPREAVKWSVSMLKRKLDGKVSIPKDKQNFFRKQSGLFEKIGLFGKSGLLNKKTDSKKLNPDSKKVNPDSKKVNPTLRR